MFTCKICEKQFDSEVYKAREVRFGWGDEFDYVKCPHCGTVQIKEIPDNLDKYYAVDQYYSLSGSDKPQMSSFVKKVLRKHLLRYRMFGKDIIGKYIANKEKESFAWIEPNYFNFSSSVLDIGCGTGRTIFKLAESGFTNVNGIDPFLSKDIHYQLPNNKKFSIINKSVFDIARENKKYDVITLTHVMEHLDNPHDSLEAISELMHKDSILILILPIFSNFTWSNYGIRAHQFTDAPRHLFIYTINALRDMAKKHHLQLVHTKSYFYYKVLQDVYGNTLPEIAAMNQSELISDLLNNNDSGHAYLYFQLK